MRFILTLSILIFGRASTLTTTTTTPATTTTTTAGGNIISPIFCSYANNTLGDCECNRQLWIAHECHSGFVCLGEFVTANGVAYEGCEIECREDEVLVVDPHNGGNWECRPTNPNTRPLICPGKFNTECACTDQPTADEPEPCKIGACECDTQVWVAHDCHEAKICDPAAPMELPCLRMTGHCSSVKRPVPRCTTPLTPQDSAS